MTKVVAVTGAAGTLGAAVLDRFRAFEAPSSVACGRYTSRNWTIHGCARHFREKGWLRVKSVDVRLVSAVIAWFDEIGHVDAVVTCAGVSLVKPSVELTAAEWREVIDVNLTGSFLCTREAVRHGATRIVFIGSIHGCTPTSYPMRAAYTASKGGIKALTESLAVEWAPRGVAIFHNVGAFGFYFSRGWQWLDYFKAWQFSQNHPRRLTAWRYPRASGVSDLTSATAISMCR